MITKDKRTIGKMAVSASAIGLLAWVVISSLGLLGCGCTTVQTGPSPIEHFRWIDQDWGICASAQPMTAKEWLWLASQSAGQSGQSVGKVNTILKLNDNYRDKDGIAVISWGFSLEFNPISLAWQTNPIYHAELNRYIRECCHLIRPGMLIHCEYGDDRTGAVVLQYRLNCGWTKEAAKVELYTNGFHRVLFGLDYFVEHATPELGLPNTPQALRAKYKSQRMP